MANLKTVERKAAETTFLPNPHTLLFGLEMMPIKECPIARIKRFQKLWATIFEKVNDIQARVAAAASEETYLDQEELFQEIVDLCIEQSYEILAVLIPDLPKEPWEDEDNGVTIPQLMDAFSTVLEVNRLEWLLKLTPFFRNMMLTIDPATLGPDTKQKTE